MFATDWHWFLLSVIVKQFISSHLIAVRPISTLSSHLCLLPSPQVSQQRFLCISHLSHVYNSCMPNHLLFFDLINIMLCVALLKSIKFPIFHLSAPFSTLGSSTLLSTSVSSPLHLSSFFDRPYFTLLQNM